MTQPGGLDHIDIVVDDISAMRAFFEAVGFIFLRQTDHGGGAVELRFPGPGDQPILELTSRRLKDGSERALGLRHMALRVADLDATLAEMTGRGLEVNGGARRIPETGRRLANLLDPAGNTLQLVEA